MTTNTDRGAFRIGKHVVLLAGVVLMLYPVAWMLSSSLKPAGDIFTTSSLIPRSWDLSNYATGWEGAGNSFGAAIVNSFMVAVVCVIGNVLSCSMAAYAFARLRFRFRGAAMAVMLGTIMLPHQVLLIPQYYLFFRAGWVNTFLPLTVPKFLAVDAFFIFLMVQFVRGLPRELDEAAVIDGCGPARIYWHIILPLLRPAMVTTAILTFVWTYDDFFGQLIYLTDPAKQTVPVALSGFQDNMGGNSLWGPMFAMSVIALIPVVVMFLIFQKRIVEGVATTGLKG
jgi:pectin-derived oligosaccharide transport system permease protein